MSTRTQLFLLSLISAVVLLSADCKPAATAHNAVPPRPTRTVTDDLGRSVSLPVDIQRIVSLAPSLTENVFAAGAGSRLVGVTTFCNYPEQATSIAKIGDTLNPNMETIVALKPDIVLVSTASQIETFTKTLEQNGIAAYVSDPKGLNGVADSLRRFGTMFNTEAEAEKVAANLDRRGSEVSKRCAGHPPTRVFVQISKEPLFTIGKGAFLNEIIEKACGTSVTRDVATAFPKLSKETASALDPEAIILSDSDDNQAPNEALKNSSAVKMERVFKINADIISRPGPRLIDALEQIAKDLHPETLR